MPSPAAPPPDPHPLLDAWLSDATASEPRVADAMQIATVDAAGRPSLRTVLLKSSGPQGLVFYTNLGSRKARQLEQNPHVAVLLHWKSLQRQVIAEGSVVPVDPGNADAYWSSRDRGSQLGSWASVQSEPITPASALTERLAAVQARFGDAIVPRPPFWSGFRVQPTRIEFWQGRTDRLHDRWVYEQDGAGWHVTLRYP